MYIKLVIFDLDGTLLYTIKDITFALNYALKKNGLDEVSIDEAKYMVGSGVDVLIQKAVKEEKKLFDNVKEDYSLFYKDHNMIQTNPYQGIMHLLKMLKQTGIKIAVLSNKPDNDTKNVVKYYFGDLFDYVLGSKENLRLKPESDGINVILDHFKIAKENTIYLGDSNIDVLTAKNANSATIPSIMATPPVVNRDRCTSISFSDCKSLNSELFSNESCRTLSIKTSVLAKRV